MSTYGSAVYGVAIYKAPPTLPAPPPRGQRISDTLTIAPIGGLGGVIVPASRVSCSEVLSGLGSLSAWIPRADAERIDPEHLGAYWVTWEHPTFGRWGGEVTVDDRGEDEVQIGCRDFGSLLYDRVIPRTWQARPAPPGALLLSLVQTLEEAWPLYLSYDVDQDGEPVTLEANYEDLGADALDDLTLQGHEWRVDADRVLHFARRIGRDRSATVVLLAGRHCTAPRVRTSIEGMINDLSVMGGDPGEWRGAESRVTNNASVNRYGLRQGTMILNNIRTRRSRRQQRPIAEAAIAAQGTPSKAVDLTIYDVDACWASFGVGDTIRVISERSGHDVAVRVLTRAVDGEQMRCAVEIVRPMGATS